MGLTIAGLDAALGLFAEFAGIEALTRLGLGWASLISGALYGVLGFSVWRSHSRVALGIAIVLFALDGVMTLVGSATGGGGRTAGVLIRVVFLIPMVRGFGALKTVRAEASAKSLAAPEAAPALGTTAHAMSAIH